ncbi:MAG: glycosyl transferase family 39 [Gallionellales bacterium RIFCSPLOWO2_02_FULL_57_47]|nr:MAG: glycosyl transferase family 39 [Gallionellales bacterium RIFCSPLOWO2_02_FULL_57_47]OGT07578.1 MAG: glycosyl transferase family 39 [Gallionellales bacterium RIFCSPHIGHO2_02_FULL_57_16]
MKLSESGVRMAWYVLACMLAVFTYFYGLDSQHIPKNSDEYPYEHITRLTAESGKLLPLQSQMENMRNTKPPLLFWQGIASTGWGSSWTLWNLRYPSVIYTLLTAAMLFALGWKLSKSPEISNRAETGFVAALTFLAFFTTYRFGRPFLTNPPEVFWIFLPFFVLLYWRQAFVSRFAIPLLLGIAIGIGFLYKSFALGLPVTLGLAGWYLHRRQYRLLDFLRQDALKVAIAIAVAVAAFALWFLLDPDPHAIWKEFVVGENVGKFDPHGPSYLEKLLWGGSSIWSYAFAFLTNAGLLTFPVIAMFFVVYRRRVQLSDDEKLLLIWIAAMFISFCLPSQRSGRYVLAAMPAVAVLCALNWQQISRKAFIATLVVAGAFITGIAYLAVRLQAESQMYSPVIWVLPAATVALLLLAVFVPRFTRHAVNVVILLAMVCLAAFVRPFDGALGNFSADAQRYASGKDVWVPCNFRAKDEGHRFILPGAEVHGYNEYQNLTANELAGRYPLFALRQTMSAKEQNGDCAACKVIGQRLDIRGRLSDNEIKQMILEGKVFQNLFIREVLLEAPAGEKVVPQQALAEICR